MPTPSLPASLGADGAFELFEALSGELAAGPRSFLDSSDAGVTPAPRRSAQSILAFGAEVVTTEPSEFGPWLSGAWPGDGDWFGVLEYEQSGRFFRAERTVVVDHRTGTVTPHGDEEWAQHVEQTLAEVSSAPGDSDFAPRLTGLTVRDSQEEYLAKISEAQAEIRDGNSYEVCLTTAVTGTLHGGAFEAYRRLRAANRAPFTQLLILPEPEGGTLEILSTSPERFVSMDAEGTVRSEPIKGTRPRGATAAADAALAEELRTHPKDRAENVMIADLVRNDLSVYAAAGTLRTERLCAVESYPSVHQMVSTISARLAPGSSRAAAVLAAFPPGSMTGAPKLSTMEILRRLEGSPRGPYSGAAGFFGADGSCDLSVVIRTAVLRRPAGAGQPASLHLGVGGAITADSEPQKEWEEIVVKSRGVLNALGGEFPSRE
ncbi:anthranilate synthase component I family protein [Nesterenkonia populi]|uniref:anthranilate synthase component I family protein n=1 Tax=Nesterenkonia populi TaxID=1591087 RepID=UPI001FED1E34|nr:anthranilate synthase component I family protein [Nesterenkonia populi]